MVEPNGKIRKRKEIWTGNWKRCSCIMLKQMYTTRYVALAVHMSMHWVCGIFQTQGQTVDRGTLLYIQIFSKTTKTKTDAYSNKTFLTVVHHPMCILPVYFKCLLPIIGASHLRLFDSIPWICPVYLDETWLCPWDLNHEESQAPGTWNRWSQFNLWEDMYWSTETTWKWSEWFNIIKCVVFKVTHPYAGRMNMENIRSFSKH